MKKFNLLLVSLLLTFYSNAQQNFTLYPMVSIPQSHFLNPATRPDCKWHFGLPALNSVYLQYSNGGFNLNKIFDAMEPGNGDTMILNANKILDILSKKNYIALKLENTWINAGFKYQNHYFNINVSDKFQTRFSLPKDLFRFIIDGNGGPNLGETFTFNFKADVLHYREFGLGYNYNLSDKMSFGGRVKFLKGFTTVTTRNAQFDVTTSKEDYSLLLKSNIEIDGASSWGKVIGRDSNDPDFEPGSFTKSQNNGFGLDLGFNFKISDKIQISAAIIDMGFINWVENTYSYISEDPNASYLFDGIHVKSSDTFTFDEYVQQVGDSIKERFKIKTVQRTFRTGLGAEFFLGGSYKLSDRFTAGALLYGDFYNKRFYPGFTMNLLWKAGKMFSLNVSNTMYNRSFLNVGAGWSVNLGACQAYCVLDNILAPFAFSSLKTFSLRIGSNFTFGRERVKPKEPKPVDAPVPEPTPEPAPKE